MTDENFNLCGNQFSANPSTVETITILTESSNTYNVQFHLTTLPSCLDFQIKHSN